MNVDNLSFSDSSSVLFDKISFNLNKGEKVVLCIRTRDKKEELIEENTITFVAIHELAHVMTKSVGHTDEWAYKDKGEGLKD